MSGKPIMRLLLLIAALFFGANVGAAILNGTVLDIRGMPVPYATVYIHEMATGIATDADGRFSIVLKPGRYSVEVSSLGYKRVRFPLEIASQKIDKKVVLEDEIYQLSNVYFKAGKDERASQVMRNAIARAPYHRQQVRNYQSMVYTKGNMTVTKIPAILKLQAGKSKTRLILNKTFVLESHSAIDFEWPNHYNETIKAFSSTIPADINPADISGVNTSSVYDKEFYGKLSPLAPNAFSYYNFVYEGISKENDRIINKIRVTPKRGDSKLISGHIYIADDLWNVTYAHFLIKETGVEIDLKVNFNETAPEVMMPTSNSMDVNVAIMGVRAIGHYNSSVSYLSVNKGESSVTSTKISDSSNIKTAREARSLAKKSVKMIEREVELANLSKETMSQVDEKSISEQGYTVVRKSEIGERQVRKGKDYELKRDSSIKRVVDSLAVKRDSSYWATVRVVPLQPQELLSYKEADSLKEEFHKIFEEDSVKKINRSTGNKILDKVMYETRFKVNKNITLGYGGLSKVIGGFSFTDGYWLGQNFYGSYKFNDNKVLQVSSSFYYSTYREKLMWQVASSFTYSPLMLGRAFLGVGDFSRDISNNSSVSDFVSSYASFLFALNPKKLLSARWIEIGNSIDIANGLNLEVKLAFNNVKPLENGNIRVLSRRQPKPNIPENIYGAVQLEHNNLEYSATLRYTPNYYYRVVKGRKVYIRSAWPTFALSSKGTLRNGDPAFAEWAMATLSVAQRVKTGLYSQLLYDAQVGIFYNKENIYLDNYHHFRASDIMVTEKNFGRDLLLANPYLYSTPNEWVRYNAEFRSVYLILNYLPFLNSALYSESLYLKGLWLPDKRVIHSEIGYSFGIQGLLRAGIFTAFEGSSYIGTGLRLEIPILTEVYR